MEEKKKYIPFAQEKATHTPPYKTDNKNNK